MSHFILPVVIFVGDLHDVYDLVPGALDAVLLQDAVVFIHAQIAVAVYVSAL